MKIISKLLPTTLLFLLSFTPLYASSYLNPSHYPAELIFLNKPIDPVCLTSLEGNTADQDIDLNKCGMTKEHYNFDGSNDYLIKEGFYGWDWKDISQGYVSNGRSYYQAWDAGDHQFWMITEFSGGGTGQFSTVSLLSRINYHTIRLKTFSSGDRCNGGVNEASLKNKKFQYSVKITPMDLLGLADDHADNSKTFDGINGCAVCCTAQAFYEVDRNSTPKFLYVDLSTHEKENEVDEEGTPQHCFDKLLVAYIAKGQTKLDELQLKQFEKTFEKTCVKKV